MWVFLCMCVCMYVCVDGEWCCVGEELDVKD